MNPQQVLRRVVSCMNLDLKTEVILCSLLFVLHGKCQPLDTAYTWCDFQEIFRPHFWFPRTEAKSGAISLHTVSVAMKKNACQHLMDTISILDFVHVQLFVYNVLCPFFMRYVDN